MNNNSLIKNIYNKISFLIIKNVNEKFHNEILKSYLDYLIECYSEYEFEENNMDLYLDAFIELEISKWEDLSEEEKLILLLKDEALEKIQKISSNGYDHAINKITNSESDGTLDINVANTYIKNLEELLPLVREHNAALAANLVSEGILDYLFASTDTNNTSLRIGRLR